MRPSHFWARLASILGLAAGAACAAGIAFAAPPQIDWTDSFNGPDSYWESVTDAAVQNNSLHVVGFATVDFTRAYITIKYGPDGKQLWSRLYEGITGHPNDSDQAAAVAVDASGNVYVTGYSVEFTIVDSVEVIIADAATLKYSPDGELLWERRFRGSGGNVQPSAIAIDPDGFVYVGGGSWINGGFDVLLLKYDTDGNLLWSRNHGQGGIRWDNAFTMALDIHGDIILGGYTQPGFFTDLEVYILKYAADGTFRWEWTLLGTADVEEVLDLTVDGAGNTYALAQYAPPGSYTSLLTVKLNPSGALVWSDIYSGQSTGDYAAGIELAPDGNVFTAGAAWENGSQNAMTLIKYTPNGQRLWVRSERGGYFSAECNDLAIDAEGAAYLTGVAFNDNGHEDFLTAKFDGSGNREWVTAWDAPEGRSDYGYLVRVLDEHVYVMGDAWRGFDRYYDITSVAYDQGGAAGVGDPELVAPAALRVAAHPNPTRGGTVLDVDVPGAGAVPVSLAIYDPAGRLVRQLWKDPAGAGRHQVRWDGRGENGSPVAPGVYFFRLTSPAGVTGSRIVLLE